MSCHAPEGKILAPISMEGKIRFRIALAGNPNVGKSVIFNNLTGLSQVVGNWPGKTVSKAEGRTLWGNYVFELIDLPGIYSLSTYSLEEIVTREYLVEEQPDFIINVVDANHLERNLYFTLQLAMLGRPIILALNQYDTLQDRGYDIDIPKLEEMLGIKVIKTVAVHNRGVHELLETIIEWHKAGKIPNPPRPIHFGKEIEERIQQLKQIFQQYYPTNIYPPQFASLKLLEQDTPCIQNLHLDKGKGEDILTEKAMEYRKELETMHGETIATILNSELFNIAHQTSNIVLSVKKPSQNQRFLNFIDHLTIHSFWGYVVLFTILLGAYALIFQFGNWFSGIINGLFNAWSPAAQNILGSQDTWQYKIVWNGIVGGILGGIGGVLPYVIPFYLFIEILQDTGYLPRAAYLMDKLMHKIGVHGKTIIPLLLGFGCNVPAITATMIMETEEEKRRAIVLSSMMPGAAVTTIVLGLVARFLGIGYALVLYVVDFLVMILVGRILAKHKSCEESELIIEFHDFRKPNAGVLFKQTWHRSKDFVYMALPLIVVFGISIQILIQFNLLEPINLILSPVIVGFLGLPIGIGVYLIYGIFRKELNLVLLELYLVSIGVTMTEYMTPAQMIIFTMVTMLYIPCVTTLIVIKHHTNWKFTGQIFLLQLVLAIVIAGLFRWIHEAVVYLFPEMSPLVLVILAFFGFFGVIGIYIWFSERRNPMVKIKTLSKNQDKK